MNKAISIYDAKTNFSKLVAKAKAGEEVIIGTYGKPEVMLVPYKKKNKLNIGVWDHKALDMDYEGLVESDPEIVKMFEDSINKPFPE
jgi:prevent-host-death family protein